MSVIEKAAPVKGVSFTVSFQRECKHYETITVPINRKTTMEMVNDLQDNRKAEPCGQCETGSLL